MKRAWILVAIILLIGGVVFEEKHRAQSIKNHLPPVALRDPASVPYLTGDSIFLGKIDLWGDPWAKSGDTDLAYSGLAFQSDLKPRSFEKIQAKADGKTGSVITVQDREVAYALFEAGGFTLTLNFKPVYPNSQALMPTRLDAGIGGSFSF